MPIEANRRPQRRVALRPSSYKRLGSTVGAGIRLGGTREIPVRKLHHAQCASAHTVRVLLIRFLCRVYGMRGGVLWFSKFVLYNYNVKKESP